MISASMGTLANHLWQSTLFAAAVWLLTLTLRKNRAAVRHRLWLIASVKFLIPFSILVGIGSLFQWRTSPVTASTVAVAFSQPFAAWDVSHTPAGTVPTWWPTRVSAIFIGVWIFGFAASLSWWLVRWLQLYSAMRRGTRVKLDVLIPVMCCHERLEPGVFGIFKPVLLLPEGIIDRLSSAQLNAVLAHELCHVQRRDNLAAAVHMFVESLFWFHPLVWWMKARLVEEQERACDEEVLRSGGDRQAYAESILKICEFYLTSPLICVSGITGSNLNTRIKNIMKNRIGHELSFGRTLLLAVVAIAVLAGPITIGVVNVKAGTAQTAQLQGPQTASAIISTAPQAGRRGSPGTSGATEEYRLGEIKVNGAKVVDEPQIRLALGMVSGDFYDESRLRKGFEDLKRIYGSRGYLFFLPEPHFDFDDQQKVVNLTINIDEGRQFIVRRISFTGNTTTRDEVIRREVLVKEGEVFNASLWDLSLSRLNQLGVFEDVREEDASIVPSQSEPKVDINLRIKEKGR